VKLKLNCGLVIALWLGASLAWADSLELKNGSLIKGKFMGGTESEISFQVGSSVQKYNLGDVVSLKFDSERAASDQLKRSIPGLLEEPLRVDGNEIVSRDAAVYGRLTESKESGTFTGRSATAGTNGACGQWADGADRDGRL